MVVGVSENWRNSPPGELAEITAVTEPAGGERVTYI